MLAYDVKNILALIPEAEPMIKQATVEEDYPIDSKASYLASSLRFTYLTKIAGRQVDYDAYEALEKGARVYNCADELADLTTKIVKAATVSHVPAIDVRAR